MRTLVLPDKIEPKRFIQNVVALVYEGHPAPDPFPGSHERFEPSESLSHYIPAWNRPRALPIWFIAAYPDVVHWYQRQLAEHPGDEDEVAGLSVSLLGLDPDDPDLKEEDICGSDGKLLPANLRGMVAAYRRVTDKGLEASTTDPSDDFYFGAEAVQVLGTDSNFTLIAENTTSLYLALKAKHGPRFRNEASLLAAAGVIDTLAYIQEGSLYASEIVHWAEMAVLKGGDPLRAFILNLEARIFHIEMPEVEYAEIKQICHEQEESIVCAIEQARGREALDPVHAAAASSFMEQEGFRSLRGVVGLLG